MKTLSKTEAQTAVDSFFQREKWLPDELKKIKRIAMKQRIHLGAYKKRFCKFCLFPLAGKIQVNKEHKSVVCAVCGEINRYKL